MGLDGEPISDRDPVESRYVPLVEAAARRQISICDMMPLKGELDRPEVDSGNRKGEESDARC